MLWALFINFRLFLFAGSNVFKLYYEAVVCCELCLSILGYSYLQVAMCLSYIMRRSYVVSFVYQF